MATTAEQIHDFFAVAAPGYERVVADELERLGIGEPEAVEGGVSFRGPIATGYKANLWSRTATRIMMRVGSFHATTFGALDEGVAALDWDRLLPQGLPVTVRAAVHHSRLAHAGHVGQAVTRIVRRALRSPPPAEGTDSQVVSARLLNDRCHVSLDMSGDLLHKRGYRQAGHDAPLRETHASAILELAGWTPETPLVDPMCGSGTFPIEAALRALHMAPGRDRRFAFEDWLIHDADAWGGLLASEERSRHAAVRAPIVGSDQDADAIDGARESARIAGVNGCVTLSRTALEDIEPPTGCGAGLVVCNPPWGRRLGSRAQARRTYAHIGAILQERFSGWRAAILVPERRLVDDLRLLVVDRRPLSISGLRLELVRAAL